MKKLSKDQKKALLKKMEFENEVKEAISKKRSRYEDLGWQGIGLKIAQFFFEPSFETNLGWDLRNQGGKLVLYEFEVKEGIIQPGYYLLNASPIKLQKLIADLYKIEISLEMPQRNTAGLDGTNYEIALFSSFGQETIRIKWWSKPHSNWSKIGKITSAAIDYFQTLDRIKNGA